MTRHACKIHSEYPGLELVRVALEEKNKKNCHQVLTSSLQLQNRSFHWGLDIRNWL